MTRRIRDSSQRRSACLYHFQVFSINVGAANFISVTFDNTASAATTNSFLAAYQSAYFVNNRQKSYLGDIGAGAYFAGDPGYLDFIAMPFSTVVLVVNAGSAGNVGIGVTNPFTIYAQASTDAMYDNQVDIAITRRRSGASPSRRRCCCSPRSRSSSGLEDPSSSRRSPSRPDHDTETPPRYRAVSTKPASVHAEAGFFHGTS